MQAGSKPRTGTIVLCSTNSWYRTCTGLTLYCPCSLLPPAVPGLTLGAAIAAAGVQVPPSAPPRRPAGCQRCLLLLLAALQRRHPPTAVLLLLPLPAWQAVEAWQPRLPQHQLE
jgi:hypothetical protein